MLIFSAQTLICGCQQMLVPSNPLEYIEHAHIWFTVGGSVYFECNLD